MVGERRLRVLHLSIFALVALLPQRSAISAIDESSSRGIPFSITLNRTDSRAEWVIRSVQGTRVYRPDGALAGPVRTVTIPAGRLPSLPRVTAIPPTSASAPGATLPFMPCPALNPHCNSTRASSNIVGSSTIDKTALRRLFSTLTRKAAEKGAYVIALTIEPYFDAQLSASPGARIGASDNVLSVFVQIAVPKNPEKRCLTSGEIATVVAPLDRAQVALDTLACSKQKP